MGIGTGMNILKVLLFMFNFIFWVLGIAVLAVGIWSRTDEGSWENLMKDGTIITAANMMIASGVFVAIVGFFGCCGAIKKSPCMLMTYAVLIFLIFILEIAAGIYAYTNKDTLQSGLEKHLKTAISNSYGKDTAAGKGFTKSVDWFQEKVKCCGSKDPEDWIKSAWYKNTTNKAIRVPESCCVTRAKDCNKGSITVLKQTKKIHLEGCVPAGKEFFAKHLWKIGGATVGIGVIQLLGIIFALCLCKAIRDEESGN